MFSYWRESPKKSASKYAKHYPPKESILRMVIWHLWRFKQKWKKIKPITGSILDWKVKALKKHFSQVETKSESDGKILCEWQVIDHICISPSHVFDDNEDITYMRKQRISPRGEINSEGTFFFLWINFIMRNFNDFHIIICSSRNQDLRPWIYNWRCRFRDSRQHIMRDLWQ